MTARLTPPPTVAPDLTGLVTLAPPTSARNTITPTAANVVPLGVQGAVGQTASLQEWRDSAEAVLLRVTPDGYLRGPAGSSNGVNISTGNALGGTRHEFREDNYAHYYSGEANPRWRLDRDAGGLGGAEGSPGIGLGHTANGGDTRIYRDLVGSVTVRGITTRSRLVVKGVAGQTDNLLEARDSADAVRAYVNTSGGAAFSGDVSGSRVLSSGGAGFARDQSDGGIDWQWGSLAAGAAFRLPTPGAGYAGLVIKGAVGQTADLQRWADSAGTVLSAFGPDGTIIVSAAGKGLRLKSPDGLTTRTLTIDNAGALVVA